MTDNLFETTDHVELDPNKRYFDELVGEGKKYKTDEDLARTAFYKDSHIKKLEAESAAKDQAYVQLREEYNAAASLREMVKNLQQQQALERHEQPPVDDEVKTPAIKPEDIEKIVEQRLARRETELSHKSNFDTVMAKLQQKYGSAYGSILAEQTKTLGLTPDMVNDLARTAPKVFIRTFGLDDEKKDLFQAPPRAEHTTPNNSGNKRTWSYYQNMKKNDPKTYKSQETAIQMYKDRMELGDAFKDGDWSRFNR